MHLWGDSIVPLESEGAGILFWQFLIIVVELGSGDLLPSVEVLEVIILEVVEDELLVLG